MIGLTSAINSFLAKKYMLIDTLALHPLGEEELDRPQEALARLLDYCDAACWVDFSQDRVWLARVDGICQQLTRHRTTPKA